MILISIIIIFAVVAIVLSSLSVKSKSDTFDGRQLCLSHRQLNNEEGGMHVALSTPFFSVNANQAVWLENTALTPCKNLQDPLMLTSEWEQQQYMTSISQIATGNVTRFYTLKISKGATGEGTLFPYSNIVSWSASGLTQNADLGNFSTSAGRNLGYGKAALAGLLGALSAAKQAGLQVILPIVDFHDYWGGVVTTLANMATNSGVPADSHSPSCKLTTHPLSCCDDDGNEWDQKTQEVLNFGGGSCQSLSEKSWDSYMCFFCDERCKNLYKDILEFITQKIKDANLTGTIYAYQLGNELGTTNWQKGANYIHLTGWESEMTDYYKNTLKGTAKIMSGVGVLPNSTLTWPVNPDIYSLHLYPDCSSGCYTTSTTIADIQSLIKSAHIPKGSGIIFDEFGVSTGSSTGLTAQNCADFKDWLMKTPTLTDADGASVNLLGALLWTLSPLTENITLNSTIYCNDVQTDGCWGTTAQGKINPCQGTRLKGNWSNSYWTPSSGWTGVGSAGGFIWQCEIDASTKCVQWDYHWPDDSLIVFGGSGSAPVSITWQGIYDNSTPSAVYIQGFPGASQYELTGGGKSTKLTDYNTNRGNTPSTGDGLKIGIINPVWDLSSTFTDLSGVTIKALDSNGKQLNTSAALSDKSTR